MGLWTPRQERLTLEVAFFPFGSHAAEACEKPGELGQEKRAR